MDDRWANLGAGLVHVHRRRVLLQQRHGMREVIKSP